MQAVSPPGSSLTAPRPRWVTPEPPDSSQVAALSAELELPGAVCRILIQRGIRDVAGARAFLRPHRGQLHPPDGLTDVAVAAERLSVAVGDRAPVLIHGDYDVDGICGTALLVRAFTMMGGRAIPFVPDRLRDGYDLGSAGIAAAREAGARLIVTTDCGIVAHEAMRAAAREGIDVIVTDHHTPGPSLPPAFAVVNPNRPDCGYPYKGLAGAGVAFKLANAVASRVGFPVDRLNALLDLVAIATIADLAPLTAENRALVRWGLAVLQRTPNPGMRALLRSSGLAERDEVTAGHIGYVLAPRLNAAGRMGDGMRGVRLLLTDDRQEAEKLAAELELENRRRRELDEATLGEALCMLERDYDPARDFGVVLASPDWHPGVIGIVASRVVERIHRPTVLIALGAAEGKGSARSIPGFHLHQAFTECAHLLLRYGGHRAAAGCSIEAGNVEAFREAFNAAAARTLTDSLLEPRLHLDGELTIADANSGFQRLLRHFGPFGIGNPTPLFAAYGVEQHGKPRIVAEKHLSLTLSSNGATLRAIGFGMADRIDDLGPPGSRVDVAFKLEEDTWRADGGRGTAVQARLVDVRRAD
jgi:single-stranded-DNA-specific exonuclease